MHDTEIEIKVKIQYLVPLKKFLLKKGKFKNHGRQIDEYFTSPSRDFLSTRPIKEWLRLRDAEGKYSFNYKNWHYKANNRADYCDEYEVTIEDIIQFKKILNALDFKSIVTVDKDRESWIYQNYEISIDRVKNLGDFVEVEYIGQGKVDPSTETNRMIEFLRQAGCGKIARNHNGYPWQLLFPEDMDVENL